MGLFSHEAPKTPPTSTAVYVRHRPETTLLYQVVQEYWPEFQAELARHGKCLPAYVTKEFDEYLKCGRLEHGFLRVRCESCHDEKLVAFSCKRRGFCPSCGARRMADSAALLVDEVVPHQPMRQWVLSVPFPLRFLFASQPAVMGSEKAGLKPDQYSVAFQSRLGRAKWLEPSTVNTLEKLAQKGVKNLLVMCPAFVTDCLETLEEIALQGSELFKQAGGESLTLIPCLNDHEQWVSVISRWCEEYPYRGHG